MHKERAAFESSKEFALGRWTTDPDLKRKFSLRNDFPFIRNWTMSLTTIPITKINY